MFCPRCGGILLAGVPPVGTAVMKIDGVKYHVYCGYKELERLKELVAKVPKKEV